MWRRVALVLMVYIALDFSDPNLPGALNFDIKLSVDAVHTQLRGQLPVAKTSILPDSSGLNEVPLSVTTDRGSLRPVVVIARTRPFDVRPRASLSSARPPSSTEPH